MGDLAGSLPPFGRFDFGLDAQQEERAAQLHRDSVIVDLLYWGPITYRSYTPELEQALRDLYAARPDTALLTGSAYAIPARLAATGMLPAYREAWDASGITAGHHPFGLTERGMLDVSSHLALLFDSLPWLRKARRAADFRAAKAAGGHAYFLQCQPSIPLTSDLTLVERAHDLGLRMLMLTYNHQNLAGSGCTEPDDRGLTAFGRELVALLDRLGVIVDTSHCGRRTTLDACAASKGPVVASHTCASGLYPHDRGKSDVELDAIAATGGVVGILAVPFFLAAGAGVTVEAMLDHIDYVAARVGWRHVAIGTDWPMAGTKWSLGFFDEWVQSLGFRAEHGVDARTNLIGFDDYRDFPNLTRGLVERDYTDEQIAGILGENFLRVFEAVCG